MLPESEDRFANYVGMETQCNYTFSHVWRVYIIELASLKDFSRVRETKIISREKRYVDNVP